jgi:hypothetical protein
MEEAIAVFDDIVARFGTASETVLREAVARALLNKGGALGELGRNEEAIAVCDDVLGRFGTASEPTLREVIDRATTLRASLNPQAKKPRRKKSK